MKSTEKVIVPIEVYRGLQSLQKSGIIDMSDYKTVLNAAEKKGDQAVSHWLHDNAKIYHLSLTSGMEPAE